MSKTPSIELVLMWREDHEVDIMFSCCLNYLFFLKELKAPCCDSVLCSRADSEVVVENDKSLPFQVLGKACL